MTDCAKLCGYPLTGRNVTKKGDRHAICPKRNGHKKRTKYVNRGGPVDLEVTQQRAFLSPRSKVDIFGHEFLDGPDWKLRVEECLKRDGGMCRFVMPNGVICGRPAVHAHHTPKKRSQGGCDCLHNVSSRDWEHHDAEHPEFKTRFGKP